ncbi:MAG TPA: FAD-binding oxidoreductase [Thermoleophilaceae bacterium]|nr:FAD-binding oxidoreductase [Thermoleophilaceae bacterium]
MSAPADVAIVGGGIVGCAAAAFLAEAGATVEVYEREEVGSAASGRNSGSIQHPFDPVMAELHTETLAHYRELDDFDLPEQPAGVLMLAPDAASLEPAVAEIARECPELEAALLDPGSVRELEPSVAEGLWACRLETGYPVGPMAATRAFARRAFAAGARFHEGETAWPWATSGRARGVLSAGVRRPAGAVLVAAGPWTPELIDPTRAWQPIVPVWGVVADVQMDDPPTHALEEAGVEAVAAGAGSDGALFTLVRAGRQISLGSTFLAEPPPDPSAWIPRLQVAGQRFVPGLRRALVVAARACARPQSLDGRPLLGELPDQSGLWTAAGHGPWGISTGPASARLIADAILGRTEVSASLSVSRF